jgi:hypothetical protein
MSGHKEHNIGLQKYNQKLRIFPGFAQIGSSENANSPFISNREQRRSRRFN